MTCAQCNRNACVCAFKRIANAGQDNALAVSAAYKRIEFFDALGLVLAEMHLDSSCIDSYMRAYDAVHAPKPKEYGCAACGCSFTTTSKPKCCPACAIQGSVMTSAEPHQCVKDPNGT